MSGGSYLAGECTGSISVFGYCIETAAETEHHELARKLLTEARRRYGDLLILGEMRTRGLDPITGIRLVKEVKGPAIRSLAEDPTDTE